MENQDFEITYNKTLKKIISFLYNHPKVCFTFYLPGPVWEWLEKNHAEFITLLTELVNRKQVEILGGGAHGLLMDHGAVGIHDALGYAACVGDLLGKYYNV